MKQNWDAIIVGTGPAGASIAKDLALKNRRVLILEKGHYNLDINIPKMLYNKEMLFLNKGKTLVRGVRQGGSSVLYYGTSFDPPEEMFLPYGIDLTKEVKELKKELPIIPLKDNLIGPVARTIMESAKSLGLPWEKVDKFIYQNLCSPEHFPFEALWTALNPLKDAINHNAELVTGANVIKVVIDKQKAIGVEYIHEGILHKVNAERIILSAGGLGTPVILQRSGIKGAGQGFFCDPVVIVQGYLPSIDAGQEIPMAAGWLFKEEGFLLTDLTLPKLVYQLFAAQALRFDMLTNHSKVISVMVKVKDSLNGKINGDGQLTKVYSKEDVQRMHVGVERAKSIIKNTGAKRIFKTAWTSAHPGGSVRIGSLVDKNLESEYKNLFICDCSVIPNSWGLPPTLTLLALSKRLTNLL